MSGFHLAQLNVAKLLAPIDDPRISDFVANLERINALAEAAPGFIWRLTGDGDNATDLSPYDDPLIIPNMSVWESPAALGAFVYRTGHVDIMRRRREWFEPMAVPTVLWWVPVGHQPMLSEAVERLERLRRDGASDQAFTFQNPYPAPGGGVAPRPILDECA